MKSTWLREGGNVGISICSNNLSRLGGAFAIYAGKHLIESSNFCFVHQMPTTNPDFNSSWKWVQKWINKPVFVKTVWMSHWHLKMVDHCRFLVPDNTRKILTEIWHHFWLKNDGEKWSRKKYFEIPRWPSEIPANLPGQFSLSGQIFLHWAAATLKGLLSRISK